MVGFFEHGNKSPCSIKVQESFGQLNYYQLVRKDFAPWS